MDHRSKPLFDRGWKCRFVPGFWITLFALAHTHVTMQRYHSRVNKRVLVFLHYNRDVTYPSEQYPSQIFDIQRVDDERRVVDGQVLHQYSTQRCSGVSLYRFKIQTWWVACSIVHVSVECLVDGEGWPRRLNLLPWEKNGAYGMFNWCFENNILGIG